MSATANAPAPLIAPNAPAVKELPPIWPNGISIDVLGVTGEYASGKTIFALTIDPKNTLLYDFEKSAGTYESLGFTRVDVPAALQKLHPNGYKAIDVFRWWLGEIKKIEAGRFSVIAVDPISDIEQGLADYVLSRYQDYGFKSADKFESTGGIFWSQVKAYWKTVLADLASRCQTFAFTTHTKAVWRGGAPTRERSWKGKDTLTELASLFLWLDRDPPKEGKDVGKTPDKPAARVIKSRLASTRFNPESGDVEIVPCLPPRLPVATPFAIRQYILNPPDYAKLKKDERVSPKQMSDDERRLLELEIARANERAKELEAETLNRRAEMQETARRIEEQRQQNADQTAAVRAAQEAKRAEQATAAQQPSTNGHAQPAAAQQGSPSSSLPPDQQGEHPANSKSGFATQDQVAKILQLRDALGMPKELFDQSIARRTHDGSAFPAELKIEQANEVITILMQRLAAAGK